MTEEPQADMPSRFPLMSSLSLSIYHIYFTLNVRGLYVTNQISLVENKSLKV